LNKNNRNINLTLPIQWFKIGEYYTKNLSYGKIADALGTNKMRVKRVLDKNGIEALP
jgi:hypothetical protein